MSYQESKRPRFDSEKLLVKHPWLAYPLAAGFILASEFKYYPSVHGQENLDIALSALKAKDPKKRKGVLLTPNHLSMFDLGLIFAIAEMVPHNIPVSVPWANKFTGRDTGKYQAGVRENQELVEVYGKIGQTAAAIMSINLFPIPQSANRASLHQATLILNQLSQRLIKGEFVGYFIEGSRSADEQLKSAVDGSKHLITDSDSYLILPAAISGSGDYLPVAGKPDFAADVSVTFGQPYDYSQIKYEKSKYGLLLPEVIMLHIARLLPPERWGFYADKFKPILNPEK